MQVPNQKLDSIDVSRRQILLSSGSFLAGVSALAWAGTDRAAAAVSAGEIGIPPTQVETPDGSVDAVDCTVTGNWQYNVNDADETRLRLRVAPPDGEFGTVDEVVEQTSSTAGSGSYTLSGSVLEHPNIDTATFSVEPEETRVIGIPVRVGFDVLHGGEPVVEALAEGLAEVEVESGEIVASAAVLGEGDVAVEV